MSLLRIQTESSEGPHLVAKPVNNRPADSYFERLLKLIPAEAIGVYLVGLQVVGTDDPYSRSIALWTSACVIFVFVFRTILSVESPKLGHDGGNRLVEWIRNMRSGIQWPAAIIATLSFMIWATALGYPLAPGGVEFLDYCAQGSDRGKLVCGGEKNGTLALLLWTPIASFLYKGDRVGSPAPDTVAQNQDA